MLVDFYTKIRMSQGDIPIRIELFGIGVLDGIVIRHISPISADAILERMPFTMRGRFSFGGKKYWTIPEIGIKKGTNQKASNSVQSGEIIYNPKTDELIIIVESMEMPNKVNKIGEITSDLDIILNARNGLNTKFLKVN